MNETLETACCFNCKFLDENDIKLISTTQIQMHSTKIYKYKYSRCDDHEEKIRGMVIK